MKKAKRSERAVPQIDPDEILPEYDFSRARPNKYAPRYQKGALVVTLDPEVAQVFQSAEDVNQTLRLLARLIRAGRDRRSNDTPGAYRDDAAANRRASISRQRRGPRRGARGAPRPAGGGRPTCVTQRTVHA